MDTIRERRKNFVGLEKFIRKCNRNENFKISKKIFKKLEICTSDRKFLPAEQKMNKIYAYNVKIEKNFACDANAS